MGIEENKKSIEDFLSQEVFFGGEEHLAVVGRVFADNVVWLSPGNGEVLSRGTQVIEDELMSYAGREGKIAILEQIAEGESVATRYRLELPWGTYIGVTLSRFADGEIREYRVVVMPEEPEEEPEKGYKVAGHGHN